MHMLSGSQENSELSTSESGQRIWRNPVASVPAGRRPVWKGDALLPFVHAPASLVDGLREGRAQTEAKSGASPYESR